MYILLFGCAALFYMIRFGELSLQLMGMLFGGYHSSFGCRGSHVTIELYGWSTHVLIFTAVGVAAQLLG